MPDHPLRVNKGEWSEFYTLVKILCDWKLYAADNNLDLLDDVFYPVLSVISQKSTAEEKRYKLLDDKETITIIGPDIEVTQTVPRSLLKSRVNRLFDEIKAGSGASYEVASSEELVNKLGCKTIKASSDNKSDIFLVIHEINTGTNREVGFSIKSQLGGFSTLLNPSGATNFLYEIEGSNIDPMEINAILGHAKVRDRVNKIYELGGSLKYVGMDNDKFRSNLRKIEGEMPSIMAEILLGYYRGVATKLTEAADYLQANHPQEERGYYSYKLQNLLEASALGMVPNTLWEGVRSTHGGYLIVKENGEVACYNLYNLDKFREYLLLNTKLDTPSTSRYKFGSVFSENGKLYMKLNLQIRFVS